jgi:uncharacterized protein YdhG (YjbR/CyaY superfamily)
MATTIDEFLAGLPDDQRDALEHLRGVIREAAPRATEAIAYGVPAFQLEGRPFVSFGAAKNHCSFYVQSPEVMQAYAEELAGFRTAKGTVHFTPDRPIPDDLVRRLVLARVAEDAARYS